MKYKNLFKITLNALFFLVLTSCSSVQNSIYGTWKIVSVVNNGNNSVHRSEQIPEKVNSNMIVKLEKDGSFWSNGNLCNGDWNDTTKNFIGKFYMPKYFKLDKLYRLEITECPGIGGDHHIRINNGKLEIDYPSVEGYRFQIFEKQK